MTASRKHLLTSTSRRSSTDKGGPRTASRCGPRRRRWTCLSAWVHLTRKATNTVENVTSAPELDTSANRNAPNMAWMWLRLLSVLSLLISTGILMMETVLLLSVLCLEVHSLSMVSPSTRRRHTPGKAPAKAMPFSDADTPGRRRACRRLVWESVMNHGIIQEPANSKHSNEQNKARAPSRRLPARPVCHP